MGKFKRRFSKFFVAALVASFLVQPGTLICTSSISSPKAVENVKATTAPIEALDNSVGEQEFKQEEGNEQEKLEKESSSEEKVIAKQDEALGKEEIVSEEEVSKEKTSQTEPVYFNTGKKKYKVVNKSDFDGEDFYFEEDGSYTINIPEENPFFPYEVQFTYKEEDINECFMTPDDSVEIGGHRFYVSANFDDSVLTQMSFNIAGDTVVAYADQEKTFTDDDGAEALSLLPLEEIPLKIDLSSYTPAELTMVSIDSISFGKKELTKEDKVAWSYNRENDFQVTNLGDIMDLSYRTSYSNNSVYQMIIKTADQLDVDNVRCIVNMKIAYSSNWLTPTVYIQDNEGRIGSSTSNNTYIDDNRTRRMFQIGISKNDWNDWRDGKQAYVKLDINQDIFPEPHYKYFKIYAGKYKSASEAMSGTDITAEICSEDMTKKDAGYLMAKEQENWITIVTFDEKDKATGCLPIVLSLDPNAVNAVSPYRLVGKEEKKTIDVVSSREGIFKDKCEYITYYLKPGYAKNDTYYQKLFCDYPSLITAAYLGQYSSISAAKAASAKEIKIYLFGNEGYAADYSNGVYVTVFIGEDGEKKQEVYQYCFKTEEYKKIYSNETDVYFYGIKDKNGDRVSNYIIPVSEDSYSEFNYLTMLVDEEVDLTQLAPEFQVSSKGTLYAKGSKPEISGESFHDFSKGAVQYTVSAENGTDAKNYWLRILKPSSEVGQLYMNSIDDINSKINENEKNGVIYSKREVYLDGYHDYKHDIVLINIGKAPISSISVGLESDVVELNDYWTLKGKHSLLGFGSIENRALTEYGELDNLAKIRIQAKDGIKGGSDVSGKLIIKSSDTVLMEITLSGTVGDPCIVTKEIPPAVKYVPYGTMIQNSNKYSWNRVTYTIEKGELPEGMKLKSNGELYGIPLQTGEFPITLRAENSSPKLNFSSSTADLVLVVNDNTNENVYTASDSGYMIEEHIGTEVDKYDYVLRGAKDQLFVSSGGYSEFMDLWLNGEKLVDGVDYTKNSGSTRITIRSQTFGKKAKNGTNTIAAEFRVGGDENKELKRTAQNFRLEIRNNSSSDSSGSSGSGSSGSSGSGSSGSSGNSSSDSKNTTASVNNEKKNPSVAYSDDSWVKDENGWWCKKPDGSWLSNAWFQLPYKGVTGWYYFNDQGYMVTGWLLKDGKWYYLNPVSDGTQGMMCSNWKLIDGQWCYFNKEGALAMNTWSQLPYKDTTKWYYFNEQGYMADGWLLKNKQWYYLSPAADETQGMMCTGWQLINKKWYYLNEEGALITDAWVGDYYVNPDGVWEE